MTPVEERIDHAARMRELIGEVAHTHGLINPMDRECSPAKRCLRCLLERRFDFLLTEHSAREEARTKVWVWNGVALAEWTAKIAEHFPVEIRCDHEAKTDVIFCDCGYRTEAHPSILEAKLAWANHVLAALPATESAQPEEEKR